MKERFETNSSFSLLLWLRYSYDFLKHNYTPEQTNRVIRNIIKKGKRQEVKVMNQICVSEMQHERYDHLRKYLFLEGYKISKQFILICSPRTLSAREYEGLVNMLGQIISMNVKKPHATILKITESILVSMGKDLDDGNFNKKQSKHYEDELSRVTLFSSLFQHELEALKDKSSEELSAISIMHNVTVCCDYLLDI